MANHTTFKDLLEEVGCGSIAPVVSHILKSEDKIKEIKSMKSNCDVITYTPRLTVNSHTPIQSTRYGENYINIDNILLNVYRIKTNFIMQQLFNRIVALESKKTVTASSCTFEDLLELESK